MPYVSMLPAPVADAMTELDARLEAAEDMLRQGYPGNARLFLRDAKTWRQFCQRHKPSQLRRIAALRDALEVVCAD